MTQQNSWLTVLVSLLLISVGVGSCSPSTQESRKEIVIADEHVLRDNLHQLRSAIDRHILDKGAPPQSLDDLISAGYIKQVPSDPITRKKDWQIVLGSPTNIPNTRGIINVRSASTVKSSEGTPFNQW